MEMALSVMSIMTAGVKPDEECNGKRKKVLAAAGVCSQLC